MGFCRLDCVFDRLLIPCRAEPPSRAAWPRERKNVAMERLSSGLALMRLDGAKKSQGACQDLISWRGSGPAMLEDLRLLFSSFVFRACRELAHPPTVAGPQAGRVPAEKRTTAREHQAPWDIQGHLAWSEVLHKGQAGLRRMAGKQGRAWQRHEGQGEVGRNNVMFEPNGEIQTGRHCPSSSPVVPLGRILRA